MRRPGRRSILVGATLLAGGGWLVDALLPASRPKPASAASSQPADGSEPAAPPDVDAVLARLAPPQAAGAGLGADAFERDLFKPGPRLMQMLAEPAPVPATRPATPSPDARAELPFAERHRVQGILLGPTPLAIIDGQVMAQGSVVDGHRVVEIRRGDVVLEGPQGRVRLELAVGAE